MTSYEKSYFDNMRYLLTKSFEVWDGTIAVPHIVLEVDLLESFPVLVHKKIDFDSTLTEWSYSQGSEMKKSLHAIEYKRNDVTSMWNIIERKLHGCVTLPSMDYFVDVPVEVVKCALDAHKISREMDLVPGSIAIAINMPTLNTANWDGVQRYLDSVLYSEYMCRIPVNPDYSKSIAKPKLTLENGRYELLDYPEMDS